MTRLSMDELSLTELSITKLRMTELSMDKLSMDELGMDELSTFNMVSLLWLRSALLSLSMAVLEYGKVVYGSRRQI